jgi:hypothetical protein
VTHKIDDTDEWDIAVCGLNCAQCPIYQAHKNKDRAWQTRIGKSIVGENTDIKPETITCDRCRGSLEMHWSRECNLRMCVEEKGYTYCYEYDEFVWEKLAL